MGDQKNSPGTGAMKRRPQNRKRLLLKLGVVLLLFLAGGAIVRPCFAGVELWTDVEDDVWGFLLLFNLILALVIGAVYLRTGKLMYRMAAIGLALQACGIGLFLCTGWEIVSLIVAFAGTCAILASGMIRRGP